MGLLKVLDEVVEALKECGDYDLHVVKLDPIHSYSIDFTTMF